MCHGSGSRVTAGALVAALALALACGDSSDRPKPSPSPGASAKPTPKPDKPTSEPRLSASETATRLAVCGKVMGPDPPAPRFQARSRIVERVPPPNVRARHSLPELFRNDHIVHPGSDVATTVSPDDLLRG